MNRCTNFLLPNRRLLLALALGALALGTSAEVNKRPFPGNALRGVLVVTQPPDITLNGKPDRLSPGSRIRDANNMLALSGTLIGKELVVNYTRESMGMVHDVWILTDEEARDKRPTSPPKP